MRQRRVRSAARTGEILTGELNNVELDQIAGGSQTAGVGVVAPRDVSTGQATGRRVELPIQITTPVGTNT